VLKNELKILEGSVKASAQMKFDCTFFLSPVMKWCQCKPPMCTTRKENYDGDIK
jgi:hypothetical protein